MTQDSAYDLIVKASADLDAAVRRNDPNLLDEVISTLTNLLSIATDEQFETTLVLLQLQFAHYTRYGWLGKPSDLEGGIACTREARRVAPASNYDWAKADSNYCALLRARYDRSGHQADIDEAITVACDALIPMREDHPDKHGLLSNLGDAYWSKFQHSRDVEDLTKATTAKSESLTLLPEGSERWIVVAKDLAAEYTELFSLLGRMTNADQAIDLFRQIIRYADSNPELPIMNANLASLLTERFKAQGIFADIDEAVRRGRTAVDAIQRDHPQRVVLAEILANALSARHNRSQRLIELGLPSDRLPDYGAHS